MEENKNTEVEVATELSGTEGTDHEMMIEVEETSSGPSKGFVALIVGGALGLAGAGAILYRRHKMKKKAETQTEMDDYQDDYYEDDFDDPVVPEDVIPIEAEAIEDSGKKSEKKKG